MLNVYSESPLTMEVWIISLLFFTSTAVYGLDYFPLNYVTAEDEATLECGMRDKAVTWTLNGLAIEDGAFGGNIHLTGPFVRVDEVDGPVLGEYACWSAGQKVSSTFLLLEAEEDDNLESLKCRAKSYDCLFTCFWHNSGYNAVRLRLDHDCEQKSCQWVSGTHGTDGSFQFELSHSLSPYAEESTMLELTIEAIIDFHILKRTKSFYLRDIVQPDSPRVVGCHKVGQELNVTIEPPSSWSTPYSFFSLENEIEYILKDDGQIKRTSSKLIPRRISKFRVRCRDSYVLSVWSQWTPWKHVKTGKTKVSSWKKKKSNSRYFKRHIKEMKKMKTSLKNPKRLE